MHMAKPLTQQEEIERARGIADFCKGKPFNTNQNEAWILGWKEMAAKFRSQPLIPKCAAITSTMNRRCMRAATIGDLCQLHAAIAPKKLRRINAECEPAKNEAAAGKENSLGAVRCQLSSETLPASKPVLARSAAEASRPYSESCPWFDDHMKATLDAIFERRDFSWCVEVKQRTDA